ncbi:dbo [Symbiodinium natans]|uniref:Dbo protein n=1 Tax=Symbiodinium natans TaxID=878477 RepID=A0A812QV86_9DINO|nr:dbo [Symbiodinium natans]
MALSCSLELKLGELGQKTQPPRPLPLGGFGKSQADVKQPYDGIKLKGLESRQSRTAEGAVSDEDLTPTCASSATSTAASPRTSWHDVMPMKVPLPPSCWKEIAAQSSSPMRFGTVPESSQVMDATHRQSAISSLPSLAAWASSESQAGFTCLSTQFSTTSPPWPQRFAKFAPPPGLERPVPPQVDGELPEPEFPGTGKSIPKAEGPFLRRFVFTGFDAVNHADFDLVPRLIGRGGCNLRPIRQACNAYIRVSGGEDDLRSPVEVLLLCGNQKDLEEGTRRLTKLLQNLRVHFARYCRKRGISPVPVLYRLLP